MKLKKIVSLALAGIMAVSMLTACGEGDSNSTVTPPVDNTTSTGLSAQLGAEASDLTNSKVTFADSTALNNALKHAVGNIGDNSINQAFGTGILRGITYLGDLQNWAAVGAAVGVLEDDMDVDVDMATTVTGPNSVGGVDATVNGLNPSNAQYNENNYNTVMLFAVDSGVEMTSIIEQLSNLIDDDMDDLVTSFNVTGVNDTAGNQHEVSYHYTCSVASTSKTFVDADTTFGVTFVAVEINRVLGV